MGLELEAEEKRGMVCRRNRKRRLSVVVVLVVLRG